ncbi:MAG: ABC transporter permease subunit [Firmicutes bacterium]|nr:ABC transporter permease subunit [Bacillota bacterium]
MNILSRELRSNLRGLLVWALTLALLNLLLIAVYPSMAADKEALDELMELFPEAMIRMFGMEKLSMADPVGYYGVEAYFMVVLFGSIYAAILGAGILAKEEDDKTIEFLLAKPVSRGRVIMEKMLAWVLNVLALNLCIGLVSWLSFELFVTGDYSRAALFRLLLAPLLVHLFFAALGFFTALFFTRRKASLSASIGLVLGLYFANSIGQVSDTVKALSWLTPFRYMDPGDIFAEGSINPLYALLLLAASAALVATTWMLYRRRDITA